ncbi:MAG: DUF502 domain-containing protein [Gammaproteobacteria bacterium]
MKTLRKFLVAGLVIWLPVLATVLVLRVIIGLVDRTLLLLPPGWRPDALLGFHVPGLGLVLAILILLGTGMLAANLVGRRVVEAWDRLVHRIPLVRSVYSGAKQVAETVFADGSTSFKRVLLVEYPRKGVWSLCFQTSSELAEIQGRTSREVACVFVPTTPNPTSGFILFVPREDLVALDMSVDEGLKMIISLGVAVPRWKSPAAAAEAAGTRLAPPGGRA